MIAKFVNPFKMLYLWGSQEALDLKAMQECIAQIEVLEERRFKLMKSVNLTEEALIGMRPNVSASTEALFESAGVADEAAQRAQKSQSAIFTQKDIIHYKEINEYLVQFLAKKWLHNFKAEKGNQYRLIMREYANIEIQNQRRVRHMWSNVLENQQKQQLHS